MRIGIYQNSLPTTIGGAARFQREVIRGLVDDTDSEHQFITVSKYEPDQTVSCEHLRVPPAPALTKWADRYRRLRRRPLPAQPPLSETLRQAGIDLLYSPSPWIPQVDVPFVVTCWDLQHRVQPYFPEVSRLGWTWDERDKHYRSTLPRASAVVVGTQIGKTEVERFFAVDPQRIEVIPFSVPATIAECRCVRPDWAPTKPFVVYPAQFYPHKNHIRLVDAIAAIAARGDNVAAVFVGGDAQGQNGTLDYILRAAKERGVGERIITPGFVSDEALRWCYENAIALVFPSLFGPDNLPPLEALSVGCPAIVGDIPGAEEQLRDAVVRVDPFDGECFAEAIVRLAQDQRHREKLIDAGRQLTSLLTANTYASRLNRLFDRLADTFRCWEPV